MLSLNGMNLGSRQRQLNKLVNDNYRTADFMTIKHDCSKSDVVNIYNLDMAIKSRNMRYVMDVLKSGDEFAISRVLKKCTWFCDAQFEREVTADLLEHRLFPYMSIKMIKQLLVTISKHLKDVPRITNFYHFCLEENYIEIAKKFLRYLPESFKINETKDIFYLRPEGKNIKVFVGNSFTLAETYLETFAHPLERNNFLYAMRYLFSESSDQYLDLLETYYSLNYGDCDSNRLGLRVSKTIMVHHKNRVVNNPSVYINILHPKIIIKYCKTNEARTYAASVLPPDVTTFWSENYCAKYKFILDTLKEDEKFAFVKNLFNEKYIDEEFEMSVEFFNLKLYELMNEKERTDWAMRHATSGEDLFGANKNYIWYKYISFSKTLETVQSLIRTAEPEEKCEMLSTLIESTATPLDVEKLLKYYYIYQINSPNRITTQFLEEIVCNHDVFKLHKDCWVLLDKMCTLVQIFDKANDDGNDNVRAVTLILNIINNNKLSNSMYECLDGGKIDFQLLSQHGRRLSAGDNEMVYTYILNYFLNKIHPSRNVNYINEIKTALRLMEHYNKKKEDIPEVMYRVIEKDWDTFKCEKLLGTMQDFSDIEIRRYLKQNAALVTKEFPKIMEYVDKRMGRVNWLFEKLRTYFSDDMALIYVNNLMQFLNKDSFSQFSAATAVRGICVMADQAARRSFVEKYKPVPMADMNEIDSKTLFIQRGICFHACYSRPPLLISLLGSYVTGEYVRYCVPMLYHNIKHLPRPLCFDFIEFLTNKPPMILKHAVRLAFEYLNAQSLKIIIFKSWNNTADAALKTIIYQLLLTRFTQVTPQLQHVLFDVLIFCTENLEQVDNHDLFCVVANTILPDNFIGSFLVAGHRAVNKLPDISTTFMRTADIVTSIMNYMYSVSERDLDYIINSHINLMLTEKRILRADLGKEHDELVQVKWDLTAKNLTYVHTEQLLSSSIAVINNIFTEIIKMWDEVVNHRYVVREFCMYFLKRIEQWSYAHEIYDYNNVNVLMNSIVERLSTLPSDETYVIIWDLRLSIEARKVLIENPKPPSYNETEDVVQERLALCIINCMIQLATSFGNLINGYIENDFYFESFYNELKKIIDEKIKTIKQHLDRNEVFPYSETGMIILLCTGLVEFRIPQVYMFMLKALPEEYNECYLLEYKTVLKTIKAFENNEVQSFMYEKFVNKNFNNFIDTL